MAAADFNGDGRVDVFLANTGIDLVPFSGELNNLLLSSPGGQLTNASSRLPTTLGYTHTAAAGPLDGNGIQDVYVGNVCCGETQFLPYFLINDGNGNFVQDYSRLPQELQGSATFTNQYTSSALVDVNNDGFPDLILGAENSAYTSTNRIYLNDGHGSFANSNPVMLPPGCFDTGTTKNTTTVAITAADLRHTGQMDLVLNQTTISPYYHGACIQVLINDGKGNFTDQTTVRVGNALSQVSASSSCGGQGVWYVWTFIVDVNGDGYPDLVLAPDCVGPQSPDLVLLNDGSGFFSSTPFDFFPINTFQDGTGNIAPANYMIPIDVRGDGKIGFVQPYQSYAPQSQTWATKFAVYQPIAELPTPPPAAGKFASIAVTSSAPGALFTVAGSGCAPGTYSTPSNLLWTTNTSCKVLFSTPTIVGDALYLFASSTVSGSAATTANPLTVDSGSVGVSIDATFIVQPLVPPVQQSVLQFSGATSVAFTQAITVGSSFTMETWVSLDAASPYAVIMGKPNNPRPSDPYMNYIIGLDPVGTSLIFAQSTGQAGTYRSVTAPFPTALQTWTHVAAVLDSGTTAVLGSETLRLYINGQLVSSAPSPGLPAGQAVPFGLGGAIPDGVQPCCTFSGAMRQARVWSRALSAAEIATYATQVLTGSENGLLADWPLDDGAGQIARDIGPNHATLTLLGSANWTVLPPVPPVLAISKTHTGNFKQGQANASYEVTVSNQAGGTTSGTVTATEAVPSGLTLVSMAGTGWTCPGTAANNCTRADALAAGQSYPAITVTVNVASNATSPQVNAVAVSGGGSAPANANDSTTILPLPSTPSVSGVSPGSGSGMSQTFTFSFSDAAGWQNLGVQDILINSALDGRHACYIAYVPSGATTGSLYLVDDAGDAGGPYTGMVLPSSQTASNSQCTINGTGSSASGSGNTLTLTLAITFNSNFAGNKIFYLASADTGTGNSGWQTPGTWTVPGPPPTGPAVGGVSPARSNTLSQTYTFTFTDTNGWQDLAVLNVLINTAIDGRHACYLAYVPYGATTGSLYLVDDAGDSGGPFYGFVLPGSGTAQNSQCAVSGAGSSVTATGNTLTLTLPITFTAGFAGNQVFFLAARSNTVSSGWQAVGSVTVP
jgi:hypothetical protein